MKRRITDYKARMQKALDEYAPESPVQVDDLSQSVCETLLRLPGVERVEVRTNPSHRACRLIHFRDMHLISLDMISSEHREISSRELTLQEMEFIYEDMLLRTELHQTDQLAALRCLIRFHGLRTVFVEGLCEGDVEEFRNRVAKARSFTSDEGSNQLGKNDVCMENESRGALVVKWEQPLSMWLEERLCLGAAGRLQVDGDLESVLPLDDYETLMGAMTATKSKAHSEFLDAQNRRHQFHVKTAVKHGGTSVIVLGGWHDLTGAINEACEDVEYIQVTTKAYLLL